MHYREQNCYCFRRFSNAMHSEKYFQKMQALSWVIKYENGNLLLSEL